MPYELMGSRHEEQWRAVAADGNRRVAARPEYTARRSWKRCHNQHDAQNA